LQFFFVFRVKPRIQAFAIGCHFFCRHRWLFRFGGGGGLATGGQRKRKGNRGGGLLDHERLRKIFLE
jgi:hypothetical protein